MKLATWQGVAMICGGEVLAGDKFAKGLCAFRSRMLAQMGCHDCDLNKRGGTMAATAKKTDPGLWQKVKDTVMQGDRGGKAGQWSARKAQLAVKAYKKQGGSYAGPKTNDNHLRQWTRQDWGTRSGEPSGKTGERYLPKCVRERLTQAEYAETSAKKREDCRNGKQFSAQPPAISRKTGRDRDDGAKAEADTGPTGLAYLKRTELMSKAADAGVAGRSRMSKADLVKALGGNRTGP